MSSRQIALKCSSNGPRPDAGEGEESRATKGGREGTAPPATRRRHKDPIVLDEVKGRQRLPKGMNKAFRSAAAKPQCKRCGRERHSPDKCPAKSAQM